MRNTILEESQNLVSWFYCKTHEIEAAFLSEHPWPFTLILVHVRCQMEEKLKWLLYAWVRKQQQMILQVSLLLGEEGQVCVRIGKDTVVNEIGKGREGEWGNGEGVFVQEEQRLPLDRRS